MEQKFPYLVQVPLANLRPPLRHTHLARPHEILDNINHAAPNIFLVFKLEVSSLTLQLADRKQRKLSFFLIAPTRLGHKNHAVKAV
jgi:hypothetical protein